MKMAFVVSGNGYGHLKRVCLVVEEIFKSRPDAEVCVVGASSHLPMLRAWGYLQIFETYSFSFVDTGLAHHLKAVLPSDYSFKRYIDSFQQTRVTLQSFNPTILVSDNLACVLGDFPKAILMGSFLWSDTLRAKFSGNLEIEMVCQYENELLDRIKPEMLGVADMAMPYVIQKTTFKGLPWFCTKGPVQRLPPSHITHVLLTGGGTSIAMEQLLGLVQELVKREDFQVSVDTAIYEQVTNKLVSRVSLFDFTDHSFTSLHWIICRPGMGILTDAVQYEVPVIVLEEADPEITFNCARVEQLGIGMRAAKLLAEICEQLRTDPTPFQACLAERSTGGVELAAKYILNH